jgi:isopentenyl-diphosphate delta-isomerase
VPEYFLSIMDDYIDIVTPDGQPTGLIGLKSEAHAKGWYHNTIHLWLYTPDGKILLQQRSHKKLIFPLLWDVSVAGHIDAGETFIEAALRETYEEIGLRLAADDLKKIGVKLHESQYDGGKIKDYEFHQVFLAQLHYSLDELIPQPEEVESLKLVDITEFNKLLEHSETNNHFVATNREYYLFVIQAIKEHLDA